MGLASRSNLAVIPRLRVTAAEPVRPARVRFGEFEFDCKAGELRSRQGKTVLQNQPHTILLMLIERPGEFVTRDEIQQRLWSDDVIVNFEVSINQAISKLRHALNDSAGDPRFIETVGRRGYRLRVPVEPVEEASPPAPGVADERALQLLAGIMDAGSASEEMKVVAAGLMKLLQLLLCLDGTGLAPLAQSRTPAAQQWSKPM